MRRRGFTMVELIIGMFITAMVLAAMAAVSTAVSNGWQQADSADTAFVTGAQVQTRLAEYFRPAATVAAIQKGTLGSSVGPATLFFWRLDQTSNANPTGNGAIEYNEIGLLRYDPTSEELRLYYASDWNSWSASAQSTANSLASTGYINNAGNFAGFMAACPNYRVLMRNVTGMQINTVSDDKPLVEFVIELEDAKGQSSIHYATVTLRAATTASN